MTTEYKTKFVQKIAEIYEKYKNELGSGMPSLMLKAFAPSVPSILQGLDENPEMQAKIKDLLTELVEAMKEDSENKE
ncbi:unnamed protein product [marine sediment metagenome]|uniref:Uncharacterized protein n=1 Tax=marine sediment metagenome TaxID=412755 RepID=X1DV14_9ZZZZ